MRLCLLLFALHLPLPVIAQPGVPVSERQLARLGIAFGPPAASGLSVFSPGVGYGGPCYHSGPSGPYYECGSYAVAVLVDGEEDRVQKIGVGVQSLAYELGSPIFVGSLLRGKIPGSFWKSEPVSIFSPTAPAALATLREPPVKEGESKPAVVGSSGATR